MVAAEHLNGEPPRLDGKACEGFLCESYVYEGKLEASANVTYLKFGGTWHRLYFEPGLIFWRVSRSDPMAWAVAQEGWDYPHTDIAELAGLLGQVLESYEMEAGDSNARVTFRFRNGKQVVIEDEGDCSNFRIA